MDLVNQLDDDLSSLFPGKTLSNLAPIMADGVASVPGQSVLVNFPPGGRIFLG
jgi:hypothetical protein